ncbi:MAG: acyltransferase [Bdellovibrionales bacterium]|nr:acyltransferase [Bdellovibrionales bacterium]
MAWMTRTKQKIFDPSRVAALDYWRALALLMVVVWHYYPTTFNLGLLGVQIFFVLSGYLVSGSLFSNLESGRVEFKQFFRKRFLRILPSYYFFLIFSSGFLYLFLPQDASNVMIPEQFWPSYYFFFKNYNTSDPKVYSHLWTLCVEEHFYLTLPFLFLAHVRFFKGKHIVKSLLGLLLVQLAIKFFGSTAWFEQRGIFFSDPAATHNNFDSLLFGVLLRATEPYWNHTRPRILDGFLFLQAALALGASFYISIYQPSLWFNLGAFKTINALAIASLLATSHSWQASFLGPLRVIAFYSYNWYLWHPFAIYWVLERYDKSAIGFGVYLFLGFLIAICCTHLVELPVYRIFKSKTSLGLDETGADLFEKRSA